MSPKVVFAAAALLTVGISATGCSGGVSSSAATVSPIEPTSYVVKELVTTTTTIAPTTTTTLPGQLGEPYMHTIVKNDNPSYLADVYSITLETLNDANRTNPDYGAFPIGGTVIIPAGAIMPNAGVVVSTNSDGTQSATGTNCSVVEHTIVAGDNPTVVANQYSVTLEDLARANATNATYLSFLLGGTLIIPVGDC